MPSIKLYPPEELVETSVTLPLSKSMSARSLIIAALTPGAQFPTEIAKCDDTDSLLAALSSPSATEVNVGAAGTTMRFLTAYYASQPGRTVTLDGSERMRRRPIGVLVDALRQLGAEIEYTGEEGYPPLLIKGRRLKGGSITIDASVSSQYISALMMVAPTMTEGLKLHLEGETASRPYILMTLGMMHDAGAEGELYRDDITIPAGAYSRPTRPIEGDWSAAAPWYEIVATASWFVNFTNLTRDSVQGDKVLAELYSHTGVDTDWQGEDGGIDISANPDPDARRSIDFSECPDLAQCLTVTCVMLGLPFHFTGLATLAIKETDRIEALRREMLKIGAILTVPAPGQLEWDGRRQPVTEMPVFDTYDDHRMAMCLAPVALYIPGVTINNPEVVSKSYPGFWDALAGAGFTIEEVVE